MKKFLLVTLLLSSSFAVISNSAKLSTEQVTEIAIKFIEASAQKEQPKSTISDIDALLAFYSDNFQVDHAKAGRTFSDRAELRKLMTDKLEDEIHYLDKEIKTSIVVGNSVPLQVRTSAKVTPSWTDKTFEYSSLQLITLELNDEGLVSYHRIY